MRHPQDTEQCIYRLLTSRRLGVLSTCLAGKPHASLVAYLATGDLGHILFATSRSTKKYENLASNSEVAMLVDDSVDEERDFHEAVAVTIAGQARELAGEERDSWSARFLEKHPHLQGFVESPTCALFMIDVERYRLVRRFQHVMEFVPGA